MSAVTDAVEAGVVDVVIVGAGPVGLFGAYYAGVRGMSTVIIDSLDQPGGQVAALYPEKYIYDIAGFPAVKGRDLIDRLMEQAAPFEPTFVLGEQASGVDRAGDTFVVTTASGRRIACRSIVITGGVGTFTPRPLPTGNDYHGRGLAYFVPDSSDYVDRDVVVVGGGDSAVDWVLMLEPIARSVSIVHRRETFRAHEHSVKQMMGTSARVITDAEISAVHGEPHVTHVEVTVKGAEGPEAIACDRLIAALGFTANLGPIATWGLELNKRSIATDSSGATNVEGIYAAGDITEYPGKVKLIVSGFGEVATAVNNAFAYLNPGRPAFPGHLSETPPTQVVAAVGS